MLVCSQWRGWAWPGVVGRGDSVLNGCWHLVLGNRVILLNGNHGISGKPTFSSFSFFRKKLFVPKPCNFLLGRSSCNGPEMDSQTDWRLQLSEKFVLCELQTCDLCCSMEQRKEKVLFYESHAEWLTAAFQMANDSEQKFKAENTQWWFSIHIKSLMKVESGWTRQPQHHQHYNGPRVAY